MIDVSSAMTARDLIRALPAALLGILLAGCGYHLAGHASALPAGITSIGIPLFVNHTNQPEMGQRVTERVIDEFSTRGRVRILPGEDGAQALLKGVILSYTQNPVVISEKGRAARYEIMITAHVTLLETATEKVLWEDDHFVFKRQYDLPETTQETSDPEIFAIEGVAGDFAASVVTSILEGF